MRISYEWLKSMVDVPEDPSDLVAEFVRTGTEVEAVEKVGADLTNVVTAQVVSKKPHPDSDHMWLCQVSVGDRNVDADGNPVTRLSLRRMDDRYEIAAPEVTK